MVYREARLDMDAFLKFQRTWIVDLHGIVGGPRHLGVRVPFFSGLSGRENLAVLDAGRIVAVGSRVFRNGVPRLSGPGSEQIAGLLEGLCMPRILGQIGQLMRVVADHKEFLRWARIGEDLVLFGVGLARGMGLP